MLTPPVRRVGLHGLQTRVPGYSGLEAVKPVNPGLKNRPTTGFAFPFVSAYTSRSKISSPVCIYRIRYVGDTYHVSWARPT